MNGNTMKKKWMSLLLVAAMVLTTLGVTARSDAAYAAEKEITVNVTVSNAGEPGKTAAGNLAVNLPVTVPADANGQATVDAALTALHAKYFPGGYATSESAYGLSVSKLWGVENGGSYLFAINNVKCNSGVGSDLVADGDALTAVVMKDLTLWSDLIAAFDKSAVTVKPGQKVELALTYDNVSYDANWNPTHVATPITGASVFVAGAADKVLATTDTMGKAFVSFEQAGTYVITASGTVKVQVQDWSQGGTYVDTNAPISAPACVVTVQADTPEPEINKNPELKIEKPAKPYIADSSASFTVKGNGQYADFVEVKVDGKTVAKDSYTVKEGSTIITFTPAYMATLDAGSHMVEMIWTTGTAKTDFTVAAAEEEDSSAEAEKEKAPEKGGKDAATEDDIEKAPSTGDASQMLLYLMMLVAAAGAAVFTAKRQKA